MKEADETKGGVVMDARGEVRGVERKRARRKFNTKSRQTNTRVSTSLPSEIHSTLSSRGRLLFLSISRTLKDPIYLFLTMFFRTRVSTQKTTELNLQKCIATP